MNRFARFVHGPKRGAEGLGLSRFRVAFGVVCFLFLLAVGVEGQSGTVSAAPALQADVETALTAMPQTLGPLPVGIANGSFECTTGLSYDDMGRGVPVGWHLARAEGEPELNSARIQYTGACAPGGGHVERMEGEDSYSIRSRDIEAPPAPGKPYDVILYQQVTVAPGFDYSVSGWMLSLCGGSAVPSDCPDGVYIRKAIGLDPLGGTDPDAESVVWVEDLRNFVDAQQQRVGWSNLRVGARAGASVMTLYLRVHSPFQWHGSHAFIDAVRFARAPVAWFVDLPNRAPAESALDLRWDGFQSPDVQAIAGGTHELLIDAQARRSGEANWQDIAVGVAGPGQCRLTLGAAGNHVEFRIRARAEQPPPPAPGAWPNQRFPGPWSASRLVRVVDGQAAQLGTQGMTAANVEPAAWGIHAVSGGTQLYLPAVQRDGEPVGELPDVPVIACETDGNW